jgi:hypothetical protein
MYHNNTTTKVEDFKRGGQREKHDSIRFEPAKTPFEAECVLDTDERPHTIGESMLQNNPNIEIKGKLTEQVLRTIYNGLLKSVAYSKEIILDIHRCFNDIGITGLKKPK